jgi:hypothetical protein
MRLKKFSTIARFLKKTKQGVSISDSYSEHYVPLYTLGLKGKTE